ncbi:hypothetical protein [Nocardia sp. NBC_00403]
MIADDLGSLRWFDDDVGDVDPALDEVGGEVGEANTGGAGIP